VLSMVRPEARGPFLTLPLGANFDPRGEVVPQGRICPPGANFAPWGEILCSDPEVKLLITALHMYVFPVMGSHCWYKTKAASTASHHHYICMWRLTRETYGNKGCQIFLGTTHQNRKNICAK
jgi:hypothetical protein